jgi:hypothetical protein
VRRDILRKRLDAQKLLHVETRGVDHKLAQLRRARLDATRLTEQPEWDGYLQQVEALNEADRVALEAPSSSSELGVYMSPEKCQQLEFERALLRAKIQARNECIEIPKAILQRATATRD